MSRLALKQGHFSTILMSIRGCSTRSGSARLAWRDESWELAPGAHPHSRLFPQASAQVPVLGLGLLQNGNVGVGVFPEGEEILIRGTSLGSVAGENVCPGEADMGERT